MNAKRQIFYLSNPAIISKLAARHKHDKTRNDSNYHVSVALEKVTNRHQQN